MSDIDKCYICRSEGQIESPRNRGFIIECEAANCSNLVCKECLLKESLYQQMIERSNGRFTAIAIIECNNCVEARRHSKLIRWGGV